MVWVKGGWGGQQKNINKLCKFLRGERTEELGCQRGVELRQALKLDMVNKYPSNLPRWWGSF